MNALFFFAIAIGVAEGLVQYLWLTPYFRFGVPILIVDVAGAASGPTETPSAVSVKPIGNQAFLVRQRKYGLARYAFYHGYARAPDPKSGRAGRLVLFIDWNAPIIGAFLSCAVLEPNTASAIFGIVATILFAAGVVYARRSKLCADCLAAIAASAQSNAADAKTAPATATKIGP